MSNFKPGDVVICVTTDDFHYYQNWKYPRLYGIYTIEIVLSDGAFTLNEIDNHHLDMIRDQVGEHANMYICHQSK